MSSISSTLASGKARFLGLLAIITTPGLAPAEDAWPLWRGTPDMRGISSSTLKFPLKQVWKVAAGRPIIATAVSDGSHAFLGDGSGKFQALALADGKAAWEFKIKDPIEGSAAILGESVIFGAGDGLVYCLNKKDGTLHWKATTEGEIKGAVNIYRPKDKPPVVLVGSYDNQLYAFDSADGKKLWTVPTSNYINGAAALAGETALFGGCDGFIYLVDVNTGKESGKIEVRDNIASTMATNGTDAYVCHYGCALLSVNLKTKATNWSYQPRDFPYVSSPALTDRYVLAGDRGKYLHCVDIKTGDEKWSYRATGKVDSSPVVVGDAVVFGSEDGHLYAVGLEDGKERWNHQLGPAIQTSPCIVGGKLIMGADDGSIYCFESAK